jgi:hypothetical protein
VTETQEKDLVERLKNNEATKDMLERMRKNPESFRYTVMPPPRIPKPAPTEEKIRPKSFLEVFGLVAVGFCVLELLRRLFS